MVLPFLCFKMISLVFPDGQIRLIPTEIIRSGGGQDRYVSVRARNLAEIAKPTLGAVRRNDLLARTHITVKAVSITIVT